LLNVWFVKKIIHNNNTLIRLFFKENMRFFSGFRADELPDRGDAGGKTAEKCRLVVRSSRGWKSCLSAKLRRPALPRSAVPVAEFRFFSFPGGFRFEFLRPRAILWL